MWQSPVWLVRRYLWLVGVGLLLEGAMLLALAVFAQPVPGVAPIDTLHNAIHVLWGVTIVGFLISGLDDAQAAVLAMGFGLFYLALAILGTVSDNPLGLRLGPGENAFHYLAGSLALLLGILAWRIAGSAEVQSAPFPVDAQAERAAAGGVQHDGPEKQSS